MVIYRFVSFYNFSQPFYCMCNLEHWFLMFIGRQHLFFQLSIIRIVFLGLYNVAELLIIAGHNLESSQTQVIFLVFYPNFSILQMLFMNRMEFSCFADFL
jgi:hypothetical protein